MGFEHCAASIHDRSRPHIAFVDCASYNSFKEACCLVRMVTNCDTTCHR